MKLVDWPFEIVDIREYPTELLNEEDSPLANSVTMRITDF